MAKKSAWAGWLEGWFEGKKSPRGLYVAQKVSYDGARRPVFLAARSKKGCNKVLLKNFAHEDLFEPVFSSVCCGSAADDRMVEIRDALGLGEDALHEDFEARSRFLEKLQGSGDSFLFDAIDFWSDRDAEGGYTAIYVLKREHVVGVEELLPEELREASSSDKAAFASAMIEEGRCTCRFLLFQGSLRVFFQKEGQELSALLMSQGVSSALYELLSFVHGCIYDDRSQFMRGEGTYEAILSSVEALAKEKDPGGEFVSFLENFRILAHEGAGAFDGDDEWVYDWEDVARNFYTGRGKGLVDELLKRKPELVKDLLDGGYFFLKGDRVASSVLARAFKLVTLSV